MYLKHAVCAKHTFPPHVLRFSVGGGGKGDGNVTLSSLCT